ncbi:DNA polymerase III subunit beta [Mycoplasmopsis glycophila]|uniref:DNA polymerase III, beta subunit n=1 Tax=Mycoplasmopsis glycophila TaxID=171285 RepID=A0A449AU39_9BACT|nr:DNA polymerase III subunit beta [Mycoplasmopsis glycophila]VEU70044.1 DNA polymerase III, beta subunit [Mycoplasmopsis glycophila]
MKFTINKNTIEPVVDFLYSYIDQTSSSHSGKNIGIEIDSSSLKFTISNSIFGVKKELLVDEDKIKLENSGRILLNAHVLKSIIKKFDNFITIEVKGETALLYEGRTKFEISSYEDHKFFMLDFSDSYNKTEIDSASLEKTINDVFISTISNTDKANSNSVFKCIHIKSDNENQIRFSATDSYRMSTEKLKLNKNIDINISADAKALKKLITKETPKKIFLFFNNSKFGISYKNTIIQINLTNIPFPETAGFFDFEHINVVKIDKNELLKLINKAVFLITDKSRRLEFKFTNSGIDLSFEVPEVGSANAFTNKYELEGPEFEMDLDFNYLKDALSVLENDTIHIYISKEYNKLLLISNKYKNNKQLITPLRRY